MNYLLTCDIVHNLIVKAKLYTILALVSEYSNEYIYIDINNTKESYLSLALSTLKSCETFGRDLECPGIVFLTALNLVNFEIDRKYGKKLILESFEMLEINDDMNMKNDINNSELDSIPVIRDARLLIFATE